MADVNKIAVGVGYSFAIVNASEVAGISLKDTNQFVKVDDIVYSLYKGEAFADSQMLDAVLDNAAEEMSINSHLVEKETPSLNQLISDATKTCENMNNLDESIKENIDYGK